MFLDLFYLFFMIPHAQTLQVASRNSLCTARGRGQHIPENLKNLGFDAFLMVFSTKNVADSLVIRPDLSSEIRF